MAEKFIEWCGRDTAAAKLERTIVQGIIGVLLGLLSTLALPEWGSLIVVPLVMSVLSPIQAEIGKGECVEKNEKEKSE